jgi:hypothetical protein
MSAYAKSPSPTAPYDVEKLLHEMHQVYEETMDPRIRPNSRSFNMCVNACTYKIKMLENRRCHFGASLSHVDL